MSTDVRKDGMHTLDNLAPRHMDVMRTNKIRDPHEAAYIYCAHHSHLGASIELPPASPRVTPRQLLAPSFLPASRAKRGSDFSN